MTDVLIKDIYFRLDAVVPEGMDGDEFGKTIDSTRPNAQGDVNIYTRGVAEQVGLGFAADMGAAVTEPLKVVAGTATRNDHIVFLDPGAEAFWNDSPNTRTSLEVGVLTVTKGAAVLFHTEEHKPFTITPTDGPVLFTRSREMVDEIRKVQD